jgi:hypothetical protein
MNKIITSAFFYLMTTQAIQAMDINAYQINQVTKQQIDTMAQYAQTISSKNLDVYLILGSANVELAALENLSERPQWMFWNLSTHEGQKNSETGNPFIDADFNDAHVLQYAAKKLEGVFTKIVIPRQPIEYTRWTWQTFQKWHSMLKKGGFLLFALDWFGENSLSNSVACTAVNSTNDLLGCIATINGYDLSYEERDMFLKNTYHKDAYGYVSQVSPQLNQENLENIEKTFLTPDLVHQLQIDAQDASEKYWALINDPSAEKKDTKKIIENIVYGTKLREIKDSDIRLLLQRQENKNIALFTDISDAKQHFFVQKKSNKIKSMFSNLGHRARKNWLMREFNKLFSSTMTMSITPNNSQNDIPSFNFKLGSENLMLIK